MKKIIPPIFILIISSSLFAQDCSDIFFSEYVEGSGNNKALEIYNPTDKPINLGDYWIARFSNGSPTYTNGGITQLEGFLLADSTFVFVNGQKEDTDLGGGGVSPKCSPLLQARADMLDGAYPSPTYMNGNDAIALFRDPVGDGKFSDFLPVDLIGVIGEIEMAEAEGWTNFTQAWAYKNNYQDSVLVSRDSSYIDKYIVPEGYYWLPWTSGHSLIRKKEVVNGIKVNPELFNVTLEWDTLAGGSDQWDNLGIHHCDCHPKSTVGVASPDARDLIVYPNPVSNGKLTLHSLEPIRSVEIYSVTGQLVQREPGTGVSVTVSVNLSHVKPGLYILRANTSGQKSLIRKIILR